MTTSNTSSLVPSLAGKVAVVTGASRGLGKRICEGFVRSGARVAMLARTPEALSAIQAAIEKAVRPYAHEDGFAIPKAAYVVAVRKT